MLPLDETTLFAATAIVLLVLIGVFAVTAIQQPDAPYWRSWLMDKILLFASMVAFALDPPGVNAVLAAISNMLLIAGVGIRWRASRQFNGRPAPLRWMVTIPVAAASIRVFSPDVVPFALVFYGTNLVLMVQASATLYEYWRDRRDGLTSRYALTLGYGLIALLFALRILKGMFLGPDFDAVHMADGLLRVDLLLALIGALMVGVFSLSLAQERSLATLRRAAFTDVTTGIPNRLSFEKRFAAATSKKPKVGFGLVLIDIDHFKSINDRYGHAAGDETLRSCARSIAQIVEAHDGIVGRIGGEEFAALLVNVSAQEARRIGESIREAIARSPITLTDTTVQITISIGLHHSSTGFPGLEDVMRRADANLYAAKRNGRNRIECSGEEDETFGSTGNSLQTTGSIA